MGKIKPQALLQQSKRKKVPARFNIFAAISCNLVVILILLSLYAAYKHFYKRAQFETDINENEMFGTTAGRRSMKFELPTHAILNTTMGSISLELYKDAAPGVVDRFLNLCEDSHFKGAHFYPVIINRVLGVGKSRKFGSAKDWMPEAKYDIELSTRSKREAFMLVTKKAGPEDGQDFELFITLSTIPDLDDKFTVFGRLLNGDVIQTVQSGEDNPKKTNVSIQSCLAGPITSA